MSDEHNQEEKDKEKEFQDWLAELDKRFKR